MALIESVEAFRDFAAKVRGLPVGDPLAVQDQTRVENQDMAAVGVVSSEDNAVRPVLRRRNSQFPEKRGGVIGEGHGADDLELLDEAQFA